MKRPIYWITILLCLTALTGGKCVAHRRLNDDTNTTTVVDSQGYTNGIFAGTILPELQEGDEL